MLVSSENRGYSTFADLGRGHDFTTETMPILSQDIFSSYATTIDSPCDSRESLSNDTSSPELYCPTQESASRYYTTDCGGQYAQETSSWNPIRMDSYSSSAYATVNQDVFLPMENSHHNEGAYSHLQAAYSHPQGESHHMYQHHRMRTNRRKRERNLHINTAFDVLRERIPNLPENTKVSKIKILHLASDYITYLNGLLGTDSSASNSNENADNPMKVDGVKVGGTSISENSCDIAQDFKIDPKIVRVKRRRTDWGRINDEIFRHASHEKRRKISI